jgi:hypothetical protein
VLRQRAERWGIADAARNAARHLHAMVEHPAAPFPDSICGTLMVEAKLLGDVVERLLGSREARRFLATGMVETCLYSSFEETTMIKATLTQFSSLQPLQPEQERPKLEAELRQQLQIRISRLASATRLLVAHVRASALDPNAGGEDEPEDDASLQLHPACRWFWMENFPTESAVSFSALWSACGRQAEFGQLTQDAKRRLFEVAKPAPSDDLRSSPRNRNDYICLHDLDVFVREEGLASLTVAGSSPSVTVEPTYDSSAKPLQSHPSAAPLEVSPDWSLQQLRRVLPEPRKGAAYKFTCHGLLVAHREEPFVRVCDAMPLALRAVPETSVAVDESTAQIPFTPMFQRRIASYEQPQTREWSGHDACTGIHVLFDPCAVRSDIGVSPTSADDADEGEDGRWQLDVVLVPGVRTSLHRQFFWEENGLIEHLKTQICGSKGVRILGVEHRAAGLEPSVWTRQTTAQHTSSTVGVLRRLLAVGVGDRPVVFITDNVGSLIVQQLLLLPCSSQSRDITQDAVAICEATLALIHFAAPMVGLTESCPHAAKNLGKLLPTSHLASQGYRQQELHEKIAYISLVQDDFAFAERSEQCLRGLLRLHISFQSVDRPHVKLGVGIFANRILHYGTSEYAVQFQTRSADSVSRPCSRSLGRAEEMDDNILLQLVTEAVRCAAAVASEAFEQLSEELSPPVQPNLTPSSSSRRSLSGTQRLQSRRQTSTRTISRRAPVVTPGTEAEVSLHVSILLRGRTHQVLDGVADDVSGLSQLPSISGAPKPFEFMFVALHVAMAEIVRWLGGDWSAFFSKVSQENPSLVVHLFGESRQLCLARTWLIHTLSLPKESEAVKQHSSSNLRCIYDLDPCHALHEIFGSVSRAETVVSQLQSSEAHGWWWSEQVEKRGLNPTSSYARNLTRTPKKLSTPGARRRTGPHTAETAGADEAVYSTSSSEDEAMLWKARRTLAQFAE